MSIETLAKQGRESIHTGLAGIDSLKLRRLRNEQMRQCFNRFDEMPYRMEFVARIRGTEFVNDAASRSVNATWYALDSNEGKLVWIANGDDNQADYSKLVPLAKEKVTMLVAVGNDTSRLHQAFDGEVPSVVDAHNIAEAVHLAFYRNIETPKVLFSPAGDNGSDAYTEGAQFTVEVNEV
ncbi:MAG: hypothetical protein Q4D03_04250 [Bacteroidales bacterium]|nr:hypothetical protein [Bacteroidales bacterium]